MPLKFRRTATVLAMLCVLGMSAIAQAKTRHVRRDEPDVKSSSVLVLDAGNSSVIFEKQSDMVLPIASISKLMTALVVLEAGQPLNESIELVRDNPQGEHGMVSRLPYGAQVARGDLLHVALMSSDNRAAYAVARSYPGGLTAMVSAMNAKAQALGMTKAHFADPTGLSADNIASSRDLAKLVLAASRVEKIREYSTDHEYELRVVTQTTGRKHRHTLSRTIVFHNTDSLVAKSDWDILLQKTGYTDQAGRCLVMKTVIRGRTLVIVLLDSFGKYTRTADARRIKQWLEARPQEVTAHIVR